MLLFVGLPSLGQQPSTENPQLPQRVPPPSDAATAQELETQGDDLRGKKAYLDSVDYYRAAWKKENSAVLHNKAGISLFQMHRDREARKEYDQAIKLDRDYAEPHNNLGALLYNGHHYGAAVKEYLKAIKIVETNATFHSNLGAAYFSENDVSHAMKEYTRALELDPTIFERQSSGGVTVKLVTSAERAHLHYLMAQLYGSRGDMEHCRYYLSKANEEGYPGIRDALRDDQFATLRKDPEFLAFVRSLKPPPPPAPAN
jgi:tetratricopeptide (TPR) repeat protein